MTLNITTGVTPSNTSRDAQIQRGIDRDPLLSIEQIAVELADAYFAYSKEGTLPGADLTPGGDKSILDAGFVTDNTNATVTRIATAICNYWSTNNAIGTPAHGGTSVVSVVIDGASKIPDMINAINAIITDTPDAGFELLYSTTESVVKTIPCTITELIPPGVPTPFVEVIT